MHDAPFIRRFYDKPALTSKINVFHGLMKTDDAINMLFFGIFGRKRNIFISHGIV